MNTPLCKMYKPIITIVVVVVVTGVLGDPVTKYKDCGSKTGKIDSLDITPCSTWPCQFPKGHNVSFTVNITADSTVTSATSVVTAFVDHIPVNFTLANPNACTNMPCPVKPGSRVTYTNSVYVYKAYRDIRLLIEWQIVDQDNNDFICFEIAAEVVG